MTFGALVNAASKGPLAGVLMVGSSLASMVLLGIASEVV